MDIKIKNTNLDYLLGIIFGISLVVPSIVQAYDVNTRLFWFPTLCFIFWVLISGIIKPNFLAAESIELSIIEKLKGWSYVFSLPITFVANFVILQYEPSKTTTYSSSTILTLFITIILMAISLRIAILSFPNIFFKQEYAFMDDKEHKLIKNMLIESGATSIWASFGLLMINSIFAKTVGLTYLETAIGYPLVAIPFLIVAYDRNKKASKIAVSIEDSLIHSGWYKKYSKANARKMRRRNAKKS